MDGRQAVVRDLEKIQQGEDSGDHEDVCCTLHLARSGKEVVFVET